MAVEFMLLGMPRSATTWASNWLTTEKTLCLHDPILTLHPEEIDQVPCDRKLGISCTALPLLSDFVNAHPARKVIVHRSRSEVDKSLVAVGLTPLSRSWEGKLGAINGTHIIMEALFVPSLAAKVYEFLTREKFDEPRHQQLCDMRIEPMFDRVHVKADRAKPFLERVRAALNS